MNRLLGLLLLMMVLVVCSGSDSKSVASAPPPPGASVIKLLMTPDPLALGDPMVNSVGMVLVPIPAGQFQMDTPRSEQGRPPGETQRLVQTTKPFYLSAYEVTQRQYEQVMEDNPSYNEGANKPVEQVSWNDAVAFCDKLSDQEGVKYRLPTEAEWEYACRVGTTTAYSFGDDPSQLGKYAWYDANSSRTTHTVGEKTPNGWGLFDMHGNVWEWCQDRYSVHVNWSVVSDPTGPASGRFRVLRGGSFRVPPENGRSVYRFTNLSDNRVSNNGFRLARTYNLSP